MYIYNILAPPTAPDLCVSCNSPGMITLIPCKHLLCQTCKNILSQYYVRSTEPSACPLCKTKIKEYIDINNKSKTISSINYDNK